MDISQGIREAVPLIVQNFRSNDKSAAFLGNLIHEVSSRKLEGERLYLAHNLMQRLSSLSPADVVGFFATVVPPPPSPFAALFLQQLTSLAVSLQKPNILTAMAPYIERDDVAFPSDLESLPSDLATQAPGFVAVIVGRGCFLASPPEVFPPDLLATWLHDLTQHEVRVSFDPQKVIEYSIAGGGTDCASLHLAILTCMQKGNVLPFPASFLATLGQLVASRGNSATADKFSQVLLVSMECHLLTKFTAAARKQLQESFASNEFISLMLSVVK